MQTEKPERKFGTREISDESFNTMIGCSNDCRYCWARQKALEKKKIEHRNDWPNEHIISNGLINMRHPRYNGIVMYPTHHDITPTFIPQHLRTIGNLLQCGNRVLICSKASLRCIVAICDTFPDERSKLEIMVTITSMDQRTSRYWEPNAPLPQERLSALEHAYRYGFTTHVICEPLLGGPIEAMEIYEAVRPFVNGKIWIGRLNRAEERIYEGNDQNVRDEKFKILKAQSNDNMRAFVQGLDSDPKVMWKTSLASLSTRNQMPSESQVAGSSNDSARTSSVSLPVEQAQEQAQQDKPKKPSVWAKAKPINPVDANAFRT
jgi:hypothetical protein